MIKETDYRSKCARKHLRVSNNFWFRFMKIKLFYLTAENQEYIKDIYMINEL